MRWDWLFCKLWVVGGLGAVCKCANVRWLKTSFFCALGKIKIQKCRLSCRKCRSVCCRVLVGRLMSARWSVRVADNGFQAGTVCCLKQCLPNVCLKILMFVAFAKMKKLSAETFCKKLLPRLRKLGLLGVSGCLSIFVSIYAFRLFCPDIICLWMLAL